jgi:hypothetical protein
VMMPSSRRSLPAAHGARQIILPSSAKGAEPGHYGRSTADAIPDVEFFQGSTRDFASPVQVGNPAPHHVRTHAPASCRPLCPRSPQSLSRTQARRRRSCTKMVHV